MACLPPAAMYRHSSCRVQGMVCFAVEGLARLTAMGSTPAASDGTVKPFFLLRCLIAATCLADINVTLAAIAQSRRNWTFNLL